MTSQVPSSSSKLQYSHNTAPVSYDTTEGEIETIGGCICIKLCEVFLDSILSELTEAGHLPEDQQHSFAELYMTNFIQRHDKVYFQREHPKTSDLEVERVIRMAKTTHI